MNTLRSLSIAAALGLASAAYAQTQTQDQSTTNPSSQQPTESSDPSAASSPHQQETTRGTTTGEKSPAPPTGTTGTTSSDPSAASSPHQDKTTKGAAKEDETRMSSANAGAGANTGGDAQVIGLEVISPAGDPLGAVVDVVMDSSGAPAYAVITSAGKATAVPYSTATAMVKDNAVVMDQSRLQGAPKVDKGAWRDSANSEWKSESDRYWGKSSMRTASPGTGEQDSSTKKKDRY